MIKKKSGQMEIVNDRFFRHLFHAVLKRILFSNFWFLNPFWTAREVFFKRMHLRIVSNSLKGGWDDVRRALKASLGINLKRFESAWVVC